MLRSTARHAWFALTVALAIGWGSGCASSDPSNPPDSTAPATGDAAFERVAAEVLDGHLRAHPTRGVELGLHEFDGKLPDMSKAGLETERGRLADAMAKLEAIDPASLSARVRVERSSLLTALAADRFDLERRRQPWRNPMIYVDPLALSAYISRDYAPKAERARSIIAIANATAVHLGHAKANLEPALPRTFIDTALLQTRGNITFIAEDVPRAMADLEPAQREELGRALQAMSTALQDYATFLETKRSSATDDYALGSELFSAMLRETQGIDVDLEHLRELLTVDLARNLAAIEAAAKKIDPARPVAAVVAQVNEDKPAVDAVLATATTQSEEMRRFLVDRDIVGIPSDDVAKVVESPPFMRWNAAFLDPAGVFDRGNLPSFYYISPPDPAWPREKQHAYIPGRTDLLFITIHEVWPGHFLHGLHVKTNPSRVSKSLWNYTMGEGWAHYTEEMMWDAGVSDDPRVHIGQLQNALLRNVRALSALGLHTGTMTVEQSKQMFLDKAFQDEANAEQQAVRGTFDPMYLAYTVGKLAILKLRADVQAKAKADGRPFSLRAFHDELLSYGAAPLGAIRTAMLGDEGGLL